MDWLNFTSKFFNELRRNSCSMSWMAKKIYFFTLTYSLIYHNSNACTFLKKLKGLSYSINPFFDLIFANILFGPLKKLAPLYSLIIKPNSLLILSGLLNEQIPYIINWYNKYGFKEKKIFSLNGWGSIILISNQ